MSQAGNNRKQNVNPKNAKHGLYITTVAKILRSPKPHTAIIHHTSPQYGPLTHFSPHLK